MFKVWKKESRGKINQIHTLAKVCLSMLEFFSLDIDTPKKCFQQTYRFNIKFKYSSKVSTIDDVSFHRCKLPSSNFSHSSASWYKNIFPIKQLLTKNKNFPHKKSTSYQEYFFSSISCLMANVVCWIIIQGLPGLPT